MRAQEVADVRSAAPALFSTQQETLRFERYSVDEGLSQSGARRLAQDGFGFLWVGTADGLNKFDGHDFTVYVHDPAEPNSLPSNVISALHVDAEGSLWVGTSDGLARLRGAPSALDENGRPRAASGTEPPNDAPDQGIFDRYEPHASELPRSNHIQEIASGAEGDIWIGTPVGLCRLDPETGSFTHVGHEASGVASAPDGVGSVLVEGDTVWAALSSGLMRFDARSDDPPTYILGEYPAGGAGPVVTRLLRASSGDLWVGGPAGFGRLDEHTLQLRMLWPDPRASIDDVDAVVSPMLEDRTGTIWIGTRSRGLLRYDPRSEEFTRYEHDPSDPASLGRAEVLDLLEDRTGILWVGTGQGGLSKTVRRNPAFVSHFHDPADPTTLSHGYVTGISGSASGDVWIGTGGGGLNRLDPSTGRFSSYRADPSDPNSLAEDYVRGVLEDRDGVLWTVTGRSLNRLTSEGSTFDRFTPDPTRFPRAHTLLVVYEDRSGRLWVGAGGGTLLTFDRETGSFGGFELPEKDGASSVQVIHEDSWGLLWLGTEGGGLYAYDPTVDHLEHYAPDPADPATLRNATVQSILEDSRGDLWIGTRGGGLSRLLRDRGEFHHHSEADGLANDVVYGIVEGPGGHLWLSTNRGLSRFDPVSGAFRNYDVTDGLQSNEFNRWAHFVRADGTILFGGINGLTHFRPERSEGATVPPPLTLTSVSVRNQVVATGRAAADLRRIELPADQNFFSLEFVALDFGNPAQNRYAYRLEGFDEDWIQAGSRRYAGYTNVGPGDYEFRLRAANNEGVWNDQGLSLAVTVLPPFWATWQFVLLATAVVATMVYALYQYRVRQLIRVERTRTRIARDLHDDLSATLSSISFFAHALRQELTGRGEASKLLGLITRSAGEAKETVRDIVWSINPEHDSWESLLAHCRRYASDLLGSGGIEYEIEIPRTPPTKPLSAEQRQDFWLTYKELLTNASRHSQCAHMRIRLRFPAGAVRLEMSDDGVGFVENHVVAGHGIRNVRARAARLGGSLELMSSPGEGTTWTLEFRP